MTLPSKPVFETPWVTVVAKTLPDGEPYYVLDLADYVSVVAVTDMRRVLFVRQYRPVVERHTLELPSGHVERNETPEDAARRELLEETGFVAGRLELLGSLVPDVGRLANRMWCYYATDLRPAAGASSEPGLTVVDLPQDEALRQGSDGTIDHALNLAVLFLAVAKRKLSFE